ncbi:MFS transporter [Brevibacterium sediminis]|uniref:MFS transporter n=2 Tax=Brevibacterium sediminis TaxID=1857024 RepID=A0A5C4X2C8_9MICO|nr:MFS transporter [Brevibacterium sediminis]
MLISDTTMFLLAVATATFAHLTSSGTWILVAIGLCIGTSDAFYRPSSGAAPRLLVPASHLGQATAARQTINQVVGFVGPALAGIVVGTFALSGSGLVSAATFWRWRFCYSSVAPLLDKCSVGHQSDPC